jgi:hypothetical protein
VVALTLVWARGRRGGRVRRRCKRAVVCALTLVGREGRIEHPLAPSRADGNVKIVDVEAPDLRTVKATCRAEWPP